MAKPGQLQRQIQRASTATTTTTTTTGWLSFFLFLMVVSTSALLMALLTPSWQVVYLEDGRTEHHHGLWLDCKRDFSYDYGRPREYYETLHRRYDLAGPFDQFWLPALLCVFKFDYILDDEDWYDHGYDENQLWGDSYQHLFLGWKIAILAAHIIAVLCAFFATISLICAFCHRLCTCIATVLVVIAMLSSCAGNIMFYIFASDQDNNIIKEEDGIYEQHFGWSFWVSLVGNIVMLFSSMFGCLVTRMVLGSDGRRQRKFIKIQLNEIDDDDSAQLLNQISGTTGSTGTGSLSSQMLQPQLFRHTKSTVYKIDSQDLRRWERETMRNIGKQQTNRFFNRTNSMPMIKKLSADSQSHCSISDISRAITEAPHEFIPSAARHQQLQQQRMQKVAVQKETPALTTTQKDVIYEYVDQKSIAGVGGGDAIEELTSAQVQQFHGGRRQFTSLDPQHKQQQHAIVGTNNDDNHYDLVPLTILSANHTFAANGGNSSKANQQQTRRTGQLIQPVVAPTHSILIARTAARNKTTLDGGVTAADTETEYLQPKGSDCSTLSSTNGRQTPLTMKNAVASQSDVSTSVYTIGVYTGKIECPPQIPLSTFPIQKLEKHYRRPFPLPQATSIITTKKQQSILSEVASELQSEVHNLHDQRIPINTFEKKSEDGDSRISGRYSKSIANFLPLSSTFDCHQQLQPSALSTTPAVHAFSHFPTIESSVATAISSSTPTSFYTPPTFLLGTAAATSIARKSRDSDESNIGGIIKERLDNISCSPIHP